MVILINQVVFKFAELRAKKKVTFAVLIRQKENSLIDYSIFFQTRNKVSYFDTSCK
jgi:hypothetical protein